MSAGRGVTAEDPVAGGTNSSPSSWESVDEREIDDKVEGHWAYYKLLACHAASFVIERLELFQAPLGPPVRWVPDHAAPMCMKCSVPFWIGRRRHHCRFVSTHLYSYSCYFMIEVVLMTCTG